MHLHNLVQFQMALVKYHLPQVTPRKNQIILFPPPVCQLSEKKFVALQAQVRDQPESFTIYFLSWKISLTTKTNGISIQSLRPLNSRSHHAILTRNSNSPPQTLQISLQIYTPLKSDNEGKTSHYQSKNTIWIKMITELNRKKITGLGFIFIIWEWSFSHFSVK